MSKYLADYSAYPINFIDAEECFLFDDKGRKYIDFLGGWCVSTVGWKHPKMLEAMERLKTLAFYIPPSYSWPEWEHFAKMLADITPGKLQRVFRATSGSEAVEFALKIARAVTGRKKIVSIHHVYHGHTYGAASVGTALTSAMAPGVPDFVKIPLPRENNSQAILVEFENLAKAGDVAAFLSEPIFTNAGVIIPPPDFYPKIAEICKKYGVLLMMDEVATGFGRTGKLFGSEHWGIEPDVMCLAKAFSGGYATIGATMVTEDVYDRSHKIPQYSTFGWMPNDLALARANVELVLDLKLWENSKTMGEYILELLKPLESLPHIGEVRGMGLLFAIEIVKNKKDMEKDQALAEKVRHTAGEMGLILDNYPEGIVFFSPPLILPQDLAKQGTAILKGVIEKLCS